MKKTIEKRDIISIIGMILFALLMVFLGFQYVRVFGRPTGTLVEVGTGFQEIIKGYGNWGIVLVVFLHAFQVVVAAIPAPVVNFAGSMIYGVALGAATCVLGVFIGSFIAFYISRLFGRNIVRLFVSQANLDKIEDILTKDVSSFILLLMFIFPSPKDFIPYFVGLTNYSAKKFFLISTIGRLPGVFIISYSGNILLTAHDYLPLIIGSVFVGLFFVFAFIFRKRLYAFMKNYKKKG